MFKPIVVGAFLTWRFLSEQLVCVDALSILRLKIYFSGQLDNRDESLTICGSHTNFCVLAGHHKPATSGPSGHTLNI